MGTPGCDDVAVSGDEQLSGGHPTVIISIDVDLMIFDMLPNDSTSVNMFLVPTASRTDAETNANEDADDPDGGEPIVAAICCQPLSADVLDEAGAETLAQLLKALADPVRVRIVSIVANAPDGEVCTCDFPALLDRTQSTVSHHLSLLVKAGVLVREQRGKWAWFRLDRSRLDAITAALR
jgi:ArsR family transcriptional regulator